MVPRAQWEPTTPLVGKRHVCVVGTGTSIQNVKVLLPAMEGASLPLGDRPWTPHKNLCLRSLPGTGANTKLGGGGREAARP